MFNLEKGVPIAEPEQGIRIGDGFLTRKQVKHIVEQRKAEGKSLAEIKDLIDHIPATILECDFELSNRNLKYIGSIMRCKVFKLSFQSKTNVFITEKAQRICRRGDAALIGKTYKRSSHRAPSFRMVTAVKGDFLAFSSRCAELFSYCNVLAEG